jgi:hypothetical protein
MALTPKDAIPTWFELISLKRALHVFTPIWKKFGFDYIFKVTGKYVLSTLQYNIYFPPHSILVVQSTFKYGWQGTELLGFSLKNMESILSTFYQHFFNGIEMAKKDNQLNLDSLLEVIVFHFTVKVRKSCYRLPTLIISGKGRSPRSDGSTLSII